MRPVVLTTVNGGINRLRTKGGARNDQLYDLLNGYVTESGTLKVRPGTERVAELHSLTRGLCAFGGRLHTFCHKYVTLPEGYALNILVHPDPPDAYMYGYGFGYTEIVEVPIHKIHFAEPFLGGLYVVAEFTDGSTYHYWLRPAREWQAETQYSSGDFVQPSVENGLVYEASRFGDPYPPWQPDEARYDGIGDVYDQSIVEPTEYNGFYYVCVETQGPNPRSGTTEPVWPIFEGGTVTERTDTGITVEQDSSLPPPAGSTASEADTVVPGTPSAPEDPLDRYTFTRGLYTYTDVQYNEP